MYQLTSTTSILHGNATIPADPANADYQAYLAWLAEGNVPLPYVAPPVVIAPVSPRQIRQALTIAGLRNSVEAAVAAGEQDTKDWYQYSTSFERLNPQVTAMGGALGVSDTQLDDLWLLAATL